MAGKAAHLSAKSGDAGEEMWARCEMRQVMGENGNA